MLGIGIVIENNKGIVDVNSLNKYLDSHISIDISDESEYVKATKLIKIVNNVLSKYDTTLLYNKKSFEKTKAFLIKDLVKSKSIKLTKDTIVRYIDNRLTGVRAFSLREKNNENI